MKLGSLIFSGALILSAGVSTVHAADVDDAACIAAEKQFFADIGGCNGYADTAQARNDCNAAYVEWTAPNGGVQLCILAEINEINSQPQNKK